MLEIDFKVELIKQLLDRIDRVHTNDVYRTALIRSMKAEERARLDKDTALEAAISKERKGLLKTLKMEEADQYILLFPDMFISLIASALNDILYSLYWIIENGESDVAKTLFEHFVKETGPIFERKSPHTAMLLERVSPLIRDLHGKLPKGARLPFELVPRSFTSPVIRHWYDGTGRYFIQDDTIFYRQLFCHHPSEFNLPDCFYHIIDAIYDFPYAPELAQVASYLSRELNFSNVSAELSFILLDAMRTVYKEDFVEHNPAYPFVTSFALQLDRIYHPARGSTKEDCEEYDYEDILTENLSDLARCLYLRNGPVAYTSLSERINMIRKACMPPTLAGLPNCFYYIVKTLREYPDAPELKSVTRKMLNVSYESGNFKFRDAPPALAYLLLDAMRSAYGESYAEEFGGSMDKICFAGDMPWDYEGGETLPTNCEKATDEDIMEKWDWVAACRFKRMIRLPNVMDTGFVILSTRFNL